MEISPHTASAFTDNLDLQLYSLWRVLNASGTGHFHTSTARHYGAVGPCANADCCYPKGNQTPPHLLQSWLLPPGMEHTSCLCSHRAALPTWLLLKWESPKCPKPPRKPQKIQAPTCQPVSSHCFAPEHQLRNCHSVTERPW